MTRRPLAAVGTLALLLAGPAPALATHGDCVWGAQVAADPADPEPVRYRVGVPTWGCSGPAVQATVGLGGQGLAVRATGGGVDWWATDPSRVGPAPAAPPPSAGDPAETIGLVVRPRRVRAGRRVTFRVRVIRQDASGWLPAGDYAVRLSGLRARTDADGRAHITARPRRSGVLRVVALDGRRPVATATVRVIRRR